MRLSRKEPRQVLTNHHSELQLELESMHLKEQSQKTQNDVSIKRSQWNQIELDIQLDLQIETLVLLTRDKKSTIVAW